MAISVEDINKLCAMAEEIIGCWHPDEMEEGRTWVEEKRLEIITMRDELVSAALVRERKRAQKRAESPCHRPECDLPTDHAGPCSPRLGTR